MIATGDEFLSVSDHFVGLALKGLKTCCIDIEKYISRLLNCSTDKNLDFNTTQTKFMLLTMAQMKACHKFDTDLEIKCMEKQLDLMKEWKLLGVKIDQHVD